MARAEHLDVENIAESAFDSPLGDGTGAGVIFGATGGVMEAALRSAYFLTTGENPSPDAFREVRDDGTISPLPLARSDVRAGRPDCALRGSKRTGQRTSASALASAP